MLLDSLTFIFHSPHSSSFSRGTDKKAYSALAESELAEMHQKRYGHRGDGFLGAVGASDDKLCLFVKCMNS